MSLLDWTHPQALAVAGATFLLGFGALLSAFREEPPPPLPHDEIAQERRVVGMAVIDPAPVEFSDTTTMCAPVLVQERKLFEAESCESVGGYVLFGHDFVECWSGDPMWGSSRALWEYSATKDGMRFKVYY